LIRIRQAGLQTTVQDLGRAGRQADGVPVCGAMDTVALRVANMLAGNDDGAAALEMTIIGPAITFEAPMVVALAGADLGARLDNHSLPCWHAARVRAGSTLTFAGAASGCYAYLAVGGGIDVPQVLGARSTYVRGHFGGVEGRPLRTGDVLSAGRPLSTVVESSEVAKWGVSSAVRDTYRVGAPIRLLDGTHAHLLDDRSRERLVSADFRVSTQSDRMGYRLSGQPLALESAVELLSEGVTLGTMQLPPGGEPIVLLADRQTTGGYPRIAHVAMADVPAFVQRRPGDVVRFTRCSLEEGQDAVVAQEEALERLRRSIAIRQAQR
jgi:antagonist of KipI